MRELYSETRHLFSPFLCFTASPLFSPFFVPPRSFLFPLLLAPFLLFSSDRSLFALFFQSLPFCSFLPPALSLLAPSPLVRLPFLIPFLRTAPSIFAFFCPPVPFSPSSGMAFCVFSFGRSPAFVARFFGSRGVVFDVSRETMRISQINCTSCFSLLPLDQKIVAAAVVSNKLYARAIFANVSRETMVLRQNKAKYWTFCRVLVIFYSSTNKPLLVPLRRFWYEFEGLACHCCEDKKTSVKRSWLLALRVCFQHVVVKSSGKV